MAIHYAGCCHPLPGDRIVGIITTGKGVTIHTRECPTLESFAATPERFIEVDWEPSAMITGGVGKGEGYAGRVSVIADNKPTALADITNAVTKQEGVVASLRSLAGRASSSKRSWTSRCATSAISAASSPACARPAWCTRWSAPRGNRPAPSGALLDTRGREGLHPAPPHRRPDPESDSTPMAKQSTARRKSGGLVENIKTIVYAGLIAIGIRTVAYEPFNISVGI